MNATDLLKPMDLDVALQLTADYLRTRNTTAMATGERAFRSVTSVSLQAKPRRECGFLPQAKMSQGQGSTWLKRTGETVGPSQPSRSLPTTELPRGYGSSSGNMTRPAVCLSLRQLDAIESLNSWIFLFLTLRLHQCSGDDMLYRLRHHHYVRS